MRGVIYVDILFFVNALIGYFLLRGAALLAGRIAADWRIFLGAAAAGLSSLLLLLPPLPQWLMWGAKIGSAVLIVFASFPVHNVRGFLKCCFWYVFLNIALSGAVFAATYYGAAQNVSTNNLSVYFNVSPLLLIGCIAGVYLAVQLCAWAFGRPQQVRTIPFTARFERAGAGAGGHGVFGPRPHHGNARVSAQLSRGARRAAAWAAAGAGALFRRRRHGDGRHAAAAHPHQNGGGHPCPACGART